MNQIRRIVSKVGMQHLKACLWAERKDLYLE